MPWSASCPSDARSGAGSNPTLSANSDPFMFNNLARPSGFSWAIAGNAAESCLDLRLSDARKQARFGHMDSFHGHGWVR